MEAVVPPAKESTTTMDTSFTKNDYAYAQLRSRILMGELAAGSIIGQARLAADMGVSTTPLREAIRRLAAEGLVELEPHRDARVTSVSAEEARHLYQVRESLDPLAASLAALERTSAQVDAMEKALSGLRPITGAGDLDALIAHRAFHRSVYVASANPVLIDVLERLWDKADRYRIVGLRHSVDSELERRRVAAEHTAIFESVAGGDSDGASRAMLAHIRNSLGRRAITALDGTVVGR